MLQSKFFAVAALVLAADRLRVLELLFHAFVELSTLIAAEGTDLQLGLHLGSSRHCTLNRHDLSQVDCFQVSDLVHSGQVVDSDLVPFRIGDHMSLVCQELSQGLSQVRLEPHILSLQSVDEIWFFPCEVAQVSEIDVHGRLLLFLKIFSYLNVVLYLLDGVLFLLIIEVDLIGVHFIIGIFWAQCEAVKMKSVNDAMVISNTYFLRKL